MLSTVGSSQYGGEFAHDRDEAHALHRIGLLEGDVEEETQSGDSGVDGDT